MRRGLLLLGVVAIIVAFSVQSAAAVDRFEATLRGEARARAERTFIYALGKHHHRYERRFHLRGQLSFTVRAADGSEFTGFQATLNSADGTGDIVLLFDKLNFVGWASNRIAANLSLARRGHALLVRYAVYRRRDSICCPTAKRAITYRWNGSRVVTDGSSPARAFGNRLPGLHMDA